MSRPRTTCTADNGSMSEMFRSSCCVQVARAPLPPMVTLSITGVLLPSAIGRASEVPTRMPTTSLWRTRSTVDARSAVAWSASRESSSKRPPEPVMSTRVSSPTTQQLRPMDQVTAAASKCSPTTAITTATAASGCRCTPNSVAQDAGGAASATDSTTAHTPPGTCRSYVTTM